MIRHFANLLLTILRLAGEHLMILFSTFTFGANLDVLDATYAPALTILHLGARLSLGAPFHQRNQATPNPQAPDPTRPVLSDRTSLVIPSPFLPPSGHSMQACPANSVLPSTVVATVHAPTVTGSIDASSAIKHTRPSGAPSVSGTDSLDTLPFAAFLPPLHSHSSPICVSRLASLLKGYPTDVSSFLINGFSHGFRLGYRHHSPSGPIRNNTSALSNPDAVSASILKELQRGHTAGPFLTPPLRNMHCSPLGSAQKKDGSLRIILDLSFPQGSSVNDGIPIESCRVRYTPFDTAVSMVRAVGTGCFMAKVDIKHAFRLCPVHPDDWHLLGYNWRDRWYYDVRLPFGSRSSPFIFNTFADSLTWVLVEKFGITGATHYLDDFLIPGPSFTACRSRLSTVLFVFKFLGVPIAEEKLEGPAQIMVYLGIEIDAANSVIRLPKDKLFQLRVLVSEWLEKRKCTKRSLLSLIGTLSFACKVVKPGRMFLRRLIDLSTTAKKLHHHIDISVSIREDLKMWRIFLDSWDGQSFIPEPPVTSSTLELFTDASLRGFGAFFKGNWFSIPCPSLAPKTHISFLEFFAVFAAISTWCNYLANKQIIVFTDNEAIVAIWASGSSKDKPIMALVRELFFISTKYNISVTFKHIPGTSNVYADLLSRLQVMEFKSACPESSPQPSIVPVTTLDILDRILSDF